MTSRPTASTSSPRSLIPDSRLRVVLVSPRIAGNVGNVARTCLAAGAELHLVGPFGFQLDENRIRRSSVGHWFELKPSIYRDSKEFWEKFEIRDTTEVYWATKNGERVHHGESFARDVVVIFGNEEEGVAEEFWTFKPQIEIVSCRIPTVSVRCLNLSVSVGVLVFEIVRQWTKNWGQVEKPKVGSLG